jgi:hypothetical protein
MFVLCHIWFLFVFPSWTLLYLRITLSSPSHCITPAGWHHAYWKSITAYSFPCINCTPKCSWHSSWTFWPLKIGRCSKTLVQNYHSTLCKFLKDCRSHLQHSWSLKLCMTFLCLVYLFEKCYSICSCVCGYWFLFIHYNITIFIFLL